MDIQSHARCFGCGTAEQGRIEQHFRWDSDAVTGTVTLGPQAQGPPNHAHGGSLATVLDEAMGLAGYMSGYPGLAVQLNVSFRHIVRLGKTLSVQARVHHVDGRKVTCQGTLTDDAGTVVCESTGLYILMPEEKTGPVSSMSMEERAGLWSGAAGIGVQRD